MLRIYLTSSSPGLDLLKAGAELTGESAMQVKKKVSAGLPLLEVVPWQKNWHHVRNRLPGLVEDERFRFAEVYENGDEEDLTPIRLRNRLEHWRGIELETQRDLDLEEGLIDDPEDFVPHDEDWSR